MPKSKVLLHICCAPCATYPFSILAKEYEVTAYFYDPNIHPESEYKSRLEEAKKYFKNKCEVIEGPYDVERWFTLTQGLADEPERGARCTICYDIRLLGAAKFAAQNGFDRYTSALSISPHKDAARLNLLGEQAGKKFGIKYLPSNWKKQDGFRIGVELGRAAGLQRQDYCGCIYSRVQRDKNNAKEASSTRQKND